MSNLGQAIHKQAAKAFKEKDKTAFRLHSQRFLELLEGCGYFITHSSLNSTSDRWLLQARRWGTTLKNKTYMKGCHCPVHDMGADKDPFILITGLEEWAGLIDGYYLKRWKSSMPCLKNIWIKARNIRNRACCSRITAKLSAPMTSTVLGDWGTSVCVDSRKGTHPITQADEIETTQRMYPQVCCPGR